MMDRPRLGCPWSAGRPIVCSCEECEQKARITEHNNRRANSNPYPTGLEVEIVVFQSTCPHPSDRLFVPKVQDIYRQAFGIAADRVLAICCRCGADVIIAPPLPRTTRYQRDLGV